MVVPFTVFQPRASHQVAAAHPGRPNAQPIAALIISDCATHAPRRHLINDWMMIIIIDIVIWLSVA
jgi:hypothetical protein